MVSGDAKVAASNEQVDPETTSPSTNVQQKPKGKKSCFTMIKNPFVFFAALLMCSEWGDRSQLAAIALAPNYGMASIMIGGVVAHTVCAFIALGLGKLVEKSCPERLLSIIGGVIFIFFGFWELFAEIIFADEVNE
jgi:putative Ca2+/H+ antiporter (TMEM165/GDT1 family)